ncbi:hypothetical protein BS78_04G123900 [Paspalum vaginatum]|nr:hypothetical protein BS78_04G123900 [Paspalum vaginatum]
MAMKNWNTLSWKIRGINSQPKWDAIKRKIEERACSIFCIQETKREHFDIRYIRNFAPKRIDCFDFIPSQGASGGILLVWNSSVFSGVVIKRHLFAITAQFISSHNLCSWKLSTVYGPCTELDRSNFI